MMSIFQRIAALTSVVIVFHVGHLASGIIPLDDVQGGEFHYNAAITPWCHLTTDLQVVEPADERNDMAVVSGHGSQLICRK